MVPGGCGTWGVYYLKGVVPGGCGTWRAWYLEGVGKDCVGGLGGEDWVLYQHQQSSHIVLPGRKLNKNFNSVILHPLGVTHT